MSRKLTQEQWQIIKTRYETGESIRHIARDYTIPESTIRARRDKEKWTQELRTQVTEIVSKINDIAQNCSPAQMNIVQSAIDKQIKRLAVINNIVDGGFNLAQMNMRDALNERDPKTRMVMANMMKATLPELAKLAGIGNIAPDTVSNYNTSATIAPELSLDPVEASRQYQAFIKGGK
ncbi:MAG: hypothetical protein KBD37_02980 [Burkholderiales bacterium]|nr:hypothetical protein [Burkholderiales bacterium]